MKITVALYERTMQGGKLKFSFPTRLFCWCFFFSHSRVTLLREVSSSSHCLWLLLSDHWERASQYARLKELALAHYSTGKVRVKKNLSQNYENVTQAVALQLHPFT